MIWYYVLLFVFTVLNIAFEKLPTVKALPIISGVNLDTTMQQAVSYFHTITQTMWYIGDVWTAALVLLGYYGLKMLLKIILGSRAPGHH